MIDEVRNDQEPFGFNFFPVLNRLTFFGIIVDVWSSEQDAADIAWMFPNQIGKPADEEVTAIYEVALKAEGGFFQSLFDRTSVEKVFWTREGSGNVDRCVFSDWSGTISPLPPFRSIAFLENFYLFPATVVIDPSGNAIAIAGMDHVGKTRTAMQLLAIGWSLVSESLAVIDVNSGYCHSYYTALGLRADNLEEWESRTTRLSTKSTKSTKTGRVKLVQAEDLFPTQVETYPRPLTRIYFLSTTQELGDGRISLESLRVYPRKNYSTVDRILPPVVQIVETQASPFFEQIIAKQRPFQ